MHRRDFLSQSEKILSGFMTVTSVVSVTCQKNKKPNIVFIMTHGMGYSDIGCFGSEIRTLHLDILAENGIRMTQVYNTGRCCPSRGLSIDRIVFSSNRYWRYDSRYGASRIPGIFERSMCYDSRSAERGWL